jgi:hypothetical protein
MEHEWTKIINLILKINILNVEFISLKIQEKSEYVY